MTPSYSEYMELRDIVIRKNAEIERLQAENIATEHARLVLWNELKARNKIFVDTIRENSQLKAKIIDLADRLVELGPANPHEDDNDFNDSN